jgi:hypothetical protein
MPGYSGTPLPKKLGIKSGFRVRLTNAPAESARGVAAGAGRLYSCEARRFSGFRQTAVPQHLGRHVVCQVSRGAGERVFANREVAGARRNVVGELAEEEFGRDDRRG